MLCSLVAVYGLTPKAERLLRLILGPPEGHRLKAVLRLYKMVTSRQAPLVEAFVEAVLAFPEVYETEGDIAGERSFRVGRREFLHVHGPALHIVLPREAKEEALAAGKAERHPVVPRSGYVQFRLRSEEDLDAAGALARIAYEHAVARERTRSPPGG